MLRVHECWRESGTSSCRKARAYRGTGRTREEKTMTVRTSVTLAIGLILLSSIASVEVLKAEVGVSGMV